ncbi:hypothetical protein CERSUDRAFT_118071 [Gelatoporia subvermispora B]|uniref:Zn(2)-C6 fungal-type domain-containing protein n=1 Tax=Ceriporiopsis subvermispora (strain B) TaxID=914234 RepID=M2R5S0_CERS8|nr:hypothetical protein CERSUDRAFT_118071 [Gelatoporia subvermispora B]
MSWGYREWVPPPQPKQRAGWTCVECGKRKKKCTGDRSSGNPCPECIERKEEHKCRWQRTLAEVQV